MVSTKNGNEILSVFPAASVAVTDSVLVPSGIGAGVTDQFPVASALTRSVWPSTTT